MSSGDLDRSSLLPGAADDPTAGTRTPFPVQLAGFHTGSFSRGRPAIVEALWILVQALFVSSFVPGSAHRVMLLRLFGARIGQGVTMKPGMRVKFPWRLTVGDNSWIGEHAWIDNLADVVIGRDCCVSQDAYLCTGSHDWSSETFDLIYRPITLEDGAWVAARATVGPGVVLEEGAVLGLGSTASRRLERWAIYAGNPARRVRQRVVRRTAAGEADNA